MKKIGFFTTKKRNIGFAFSSLLLLITFSFFSCEPDEPMTTEEEAVANSIPTSLPLSEITMNDLSQFEAEGAWQVVGDVMADFNTSKTLSTQSGTGVIALTENTSATLTSKFGHGDIELTLDFLLPKDGVATLLLQGNYGISLQDSWNINAINQQTCGVIADYLPAFNACKAPGLWQTLKILFRAPKFDEAGSLLTSAKIEYIYLNDMPIQRDLELEFDASQAQGNLVLQTETPIALRNLMVKQFGNKKVAVDNIQYRIYEGTWDYIPDFDTLTAIGTGTVDTITALEDLANLKDHFGLVFEGDMTIPTTGTYLFETQIDDGGDLYIDDELVIHNEGEPGMGTERVMIDLEAGQHKFKLTYYEEVWSAWISIFVEGPEIEKQPLASLALGGGGNKKQTDIIEVTPSETPEMVRAFINYGAEKRTHTIGVGDPTGIHYAYDLREGALLNAWKGRFADVTEMWKGRGHSQLLKPLNAVMEATAGVPVAQLSNEKMAWAAAMSDDFKALGYSINADERPVFKYQLGALQWSDSIEPNGNQLKRTIIWKDNADNYYFRIAAASTIQQLENGLYNIGGDYYVNYTNKVNEKPIIRSSKTGQELIVPMQGSTAVEYELIW